MSLKVNTLGRSDYTHVDIMLYGASGAGKTHLASTAPQPLYCVAGDPTGHKAIPYKADGVMPKTLNDLREVIEGFHEGGHGYKTLLIDGYNLIFNLFVNEVAQSFFDQTGKGDPDLVPLNAWNKIYRMFERFTRSIVDMTQVDGDRVHVIFTTIEERVKEDEYAPFAIRPFVGTEKLNTFIIPIPSIIGYVKPIGGETDGEPNQTREVLFYKRGTEYARDRLGMFPPKVEGLNLSDYLK